MNIKIDYINIAVLLGCVLLIGICLLWGFLATNTYKYKQTIKFTTTDKLHTGKANNLYVLKDHHVVFYLSESYKLPYKPIYLLQVKDSAGNLLGNVASECASLQDGDKKTKNNKFILYFPELKFKTTKDSSFILSITDLTNISGLASLVSYEGHLLHN